MAKSFSAVGAIIRCVSSVFFVDESGGYSKGGFDHSPLPGESSSSPANASTHYDNNKRISILKHLRFIHALAGLIALILVMAEILGIINLSNQASSFESASTLIILMAALSNLCISSFPRSRSKGGRGLQVIASVVMITAFVPALLPFLQSAQLIAGYEPGFIAVSMLMFSALLFFICNLGGTASPSVDYEYNNRETGTVKWFNVTKGFGFITRDSGDDVFVHYRAIRGEGHRILTEGQRVEFEVVDKDKGQQAEDVVAAPKGH